MKAFDRFFAWLESAPLPFLFGSVLIVRLVYVIALGLLADLNPYEDYYDDIARSLISGKGFFVSGEVEHSLVRYPLYPLLLAGCFRLFGYGQGFVTLQYLLDALTLLVIYRLGKECFEEGTARLGVVLASFYPFTALYILRCLPETLFTLLIALSLLTLCRAHRRAKLLGFIVTGFALGLTTLCKSVGFYFALVVPLLALLPRFGGWRTAASHLLIPLVALLTILPWGLRNYFVTGRLILLGTAGPYSLYIGNNLATDGRDRDEVGEQHREIFMAHMLEVAQGHSPTSPEASAPLRAAVRRQFAEHPGASLWLIVRKAGRFWVDVYGPRNKLFQWIVAPVQVAVLLMAVPGILLALRLGCPVWPLLLAILYMNGIHALVLSTFRYSVPIMPEMMLFAALTIRSLCNDPYERTLVT
jgi:4-amino-4-deoxy-L-arabinose transferase-like glycosyltransferase